MNHKILTTVFIFLSVHCFAGGIPKTMPDDFSIYYSSQGNDVSNHPRIYLCLAECIVESRVDYNSDLSTYSFTIGRDELSSLYNALYSLNAFKLKFKTDKEKNRGGEEIIYTISGKRYTIKNAGVFFIVPKHLNHFNECVDLIIGCADRHRH